MIVRDEVRTLILYAVTDVFQIWAN